MEKSAPYPSAPWGEHLLLGKEPMFWQFGPLGLWCKGMADEVWIAVGKGTDAVPEDDAWSRWALERPYQGIDLLPAFPKRPVVVKPEVPFHLLRNGGKATIYIRVPLCVRMDLLDGQRRSTLIETPIVPLADTWFGSYMDGELCYWISSGTRRDLELDAGRPHLATCTVHIRNNSGDDLHVDKICLIVGHLSLFEQGGCLLSDEATIDFKGAQEVSGFSVSGSSPLPEAVLLSPPRTPMKQDIGAKMLLSFIS